MVQNGSEFIIAEARRKSEQLWTHAPEHVKSSKHLRACMCWKGDWIRLYACTGTHSVFLPEPAGRAEQPWPHAQEHATDIERI